MGSASGLRGKAVLILEDEPLIALDIAEQVSASGAHSIVTTCVEQALSALARIKCAVAIIDYRLGDGDACEVIKRLEGARIPFVVYSGDEEVLTSGPIVLKPAASGLLIHTISHLLG